MRRKLFFITIFLIVIVCIIDCKNPFNSKDVVEFQLDNPIYIKGRITSIEYKDKDYYQIGVEAVSGHNILLNYYKPIDNYGRLYLTYNIFSATLSEPQSKRNPGCFDYKKHLMSAGISHIGTIHNFETMNEDFSFIEIIRKRIFQSKIDFLNEIKNDKAKGMISGVLFGEKELLDEDIYEQFVENGTAHILAVSGLHIGIIYGCLEKILGKKNSFFKVVAIILALLFMGELASWSISVTRAIGMIIMKIIAMCLDRRYDQLTAASIMALLFITNNHNVIFNTGFQMSFLAVMSIAFILPHISSKIPDYLAVVMAVNLGLAPYQMYQFNTFSVVSLIVNIPVVYIAGIFMPIAGLAFLLFLLGINLPIINFILESLAVFIVKINHWFSFGMDSYDVASPPLWLILIIYGGGFFLLSENFYILIVRKNFNRIAILITLITMVSVSIAFSYPNWAKDYQLVFVDVGQGAAVHIRQGNRNILIDGGGNINYNVGKKILKPYLLKNGCKKVDLALATHLHTDHYLGLKELDEEGMISMLKSKLIAGNIYKISKNFSIKTLWPLKEKIEVNGEDPSQDENENCSVFMIYYDDVRILITGDLDEEGEKEMMAYYKDKSIFKADIMQIGHHGSGYSTCDEFLNLVDPTYCVIQVGKNNYGHPHAKIIEKCVKKGIILFRNDLDGAVGFSIDDDIKFQRMIKDR